jgi:hypothetical protein
MTQQMEVWLDSGAYSAWRLGQSIDLDAYIQLLQTDGDRFHCYFSLDVIPGEYGQIDYRPDQVEAAAQRSYQNHRKMRAAGLKPIPVHHNAEPIVWLKRYLDDGEDMIALSVKGTYNMMPWLDQCFAVLKSYPQVKVHGLSATSMPILNRYPFTSVDSSTWVYQSKLGQVPFPRFTNGRPNYKLRPLLVSVSDKTIARLNHETGKRAFERERLVQHLKEIGLTLAELRDHHHPRWRCWLSYWAGVQSTTTTTIVPVSNGDAHEVQMLTEFGFNRTMLSFYRNNPAALRRIGIPC